jgi:hypothetical protein
VVELAGSRRPGRIRTVAGRFAVIGNPLLVRRVDAEVGFDPVEARF